MIDSGASKDMVDEYEYTRLDKVPKLKPFSTKLYAFKLEEPLKILGEFDADLKYETYFAFQYKGGTRVLKAA